MSIPETTSKSITDEILFMTRLSHIGLLPVLQYIEEHNPSAHLPYHNNHHAFNVARLADQIYSFYCGNEFRTLITAALFHDFNHSGGEESDSVNIARAVAGFEEFARAGRLDKVEMPEFVQEDIKRLIRTTEFPHHNDEPVGLLANILRDADVISASIDSPVVVMEGLRKEMEVSTGVEISYSDMLERQRRFFSTYHPHTPLGMMIWNSVSVKAISAQEDYVKLVTK